MTTRLALYNKALVEHLDERRLTSLSENREPLRVMNDIWDGGAIGACLAAGLWNFAMRTQMLDYSPSVEPDFGYRRAFDKPADWVRTAAVASDEYFREPLLAFNDEAGYWFADLDTIYVRFVSSDEEYGNDLSRWPENFTDYVAAYFAWKAAGRITGSKTSKQVIAQDMRALLAEAKKTDAMDEQAKLLPTGGWVRARQGSPARDGGSRSRLIG